MKNKPLTFLRTLWHCLYNAALTTLRHDGFEHAGYLAFLSLLAMFPFLVFVVAIIGLVGQGAAGAALITQVLQTLPAHVAGALQPRIDQIVTGPPQGLLTVSILGAIWTASSAVEGGRTILNRAYHVSTPPAFWLRRLLSILQVLIFTFIFISGMVLMVAIPYSLHHLEEFINVHFMVEYKDYWGKLAFLLTVGVMFLAVCYIYYMIPNIKQRFISVAPGALMVVIFWLTAAQLFSLYLNDFSQMDVIYGSLGGVIATLLFFYICNIIFIYGAEFNYQMVEVLGLLVVEREHISEEQPEESRSST